MGLVCGVLERDPSTRGTSLRLLQAQGAAGKEPGTAGEGAGTGGLAPGRCPPADPLPPAWPRRCGCGHRCGGGRLPDGHGAPAPYQPPQGAGKAPRPAVLHPALLPHSAAEPGGSQQELTYLLLAAAASSARLRSRPPPCCSGLWLCTAPPDPPRGSPVPPEHGKELQPQQDLLAPRDPVPKGGWWDWDPVTPPSLGPHWSGAVPPPHSVLWAPWPQCPQFSARSRTGATMRADSSLRRPIPSVCLEMSAFSAPAPRSNRLKMVQITATPPPSTPGLPRGLLPCTAGLSAEPRTVQGTASPVSMGHPHTAHHCEAANEGEMGKLRQPQGGGHCPLQGCS